MTCGGWRRIPWPEAGMLQDCPGCVDCAGKSQSPPNQKFTYSNPLGIYTDILDPILSDDKDYPLSGGKFWCLATKATRDTVHRWMIASREGWPNKSFLENYSTGPTTRGEYLTPKEWDLLILRNKLDPDSFQVSRRANFTFI